MNRQPSLVAVITAGRSPSEDDPLAAYTRGASKALIPIGGRPMIAHVVAAIASSRYVRHVAIVALDPATPVEFPIPVDHIPDTGSMLDNIAAGLQHAQNRYPSLDAILLSSSDIPTVTPSIVDAFVEECFRTDHEIYYSVVERDVMERRFPGSRRSYVHLREGDFAGGDMLVIRPGLLLRQRALWQRLAAARKHALRQASMFGTWPLLRLLTRRMSLEEAEQRASRALGVRGRAVPCPYAEIAMDVDKPFQLEIVRAEIEARIADSPPARC
jgi:CTP:molybdopterin cytidylyltransferase MocA